MERNIVKPPSVDAGVRRVPFVKGAGVFFPSQHFLGSALNSLSERRQDISHRGSAGARGAGDRRSGARAGQGREGANEKVRGGQEKRRKCRVEGK